MRQGLRIVCNTLALCFLIANAAEAQSGKKVSGIADVGSLLAELRRAQLSSPPVLAGRTVTRNIGNVVVDTVTGEWPASLTGNLVPERAGDGNVSWPFYMYEDAISHDALLGASGFSVGFFIELGRGRVLQDGRTRHS